MDASLEDIPPGPLLVLAPVLAACTQSPETTFDWGVNDRLAGSSLRPQRSRTRSDLPRVYVYQGDAYAVPAPKPRPNYQALIILAVRARLSGAVRAAAYQSRRGQRQCAHFCLAGLGQCDFQFRRRQQWRAQ